jgi:site-specific DNA-cytosine methylase
MIRPQFILDLNTELIVDNFAGGGGASCGIEMALGRHVDHAINHDRHALLTPRELFRAQGALIRCNVPELAVKFGKEKAVLA